MLTKAQVETYTRDGFVIIPKVISSDKLQAMRDELDKWIEESKSYKENYGKHLMVKHVLIWKKGIV